MLDITRILTEKKFRNDVLSYVVDPGGTQLLDD
jgi:hypothetical protein